jgi:ABC-type nickel/cobalt efflux system permease component RcnA
MTLGMIVTIAGVTLTATLARGRFMSLLARTEGWRHRAGQVLEIAGAAMVLTLGLWLIVSAAT